MRRYPRLYGADKKMITDLRTASFGYTARQYPLSTATLRVPVSDAGVVSFRSYVELFSAKGRIDLFRVAEMPQKTTGKEAEFALDHVLCTLRDDIVPGYKELGGTGVPLKKVIGTVLSYQRTTHWALARCDFNTEYMYSLSDENLLSALLSLLEPLEEDWMIETDTTVTPWQLSVVRLTNEDATELRYRRNMVEVKESYEESNFCNRIYPRGYGEGVNQLTIRDANNGVEYLEDAASIAKYGVVARPWAATTITDAKTLRAAGAAALALCKEPYKTYAVRAIDLSRLTGEPLDAFYPGKMVRVVDSEEGSVVRVRLIEASYKDPIGKPDEVDLTLANRPTDIGSILAELERKARIGELYSQGTSVFYPMQVADNADASTPLEVSFYIPDSCVNVNKVLLKWAFRRFRADSQAAAAGGGRVDSTTAGGGAQTVTSEGGSTSLSAGQTITLDSGVGFNTDASSMSVTNEASSSYSRVTDSASGSGTHTHGIGTHRHYMSHTHSLYHSHNVAGHTHAVKGHSHSFSVDAHSHSFTLPDHTHPITYGIYLGSQAGSCTIKVDGTTIPTPEGQEVDIAAYLSKNDAGKIHRNTWHTVALYPNTLTGLTVNLFVQTFINAVTGELL